MAEILLVSCPPWGVVMPPLGVACLAEYLRAEGITLQVQDLNLDLYERATAQGRSFWDFDTINRIPAPQIAARLHDAFGTVMEEFIQRTQSFPVIGFSANNLISAAFAGIVATRIKQQYPDKVLIVGGPGIFYSWDRQWISPGAIDFFIIGEGEVALVKLLRSLRSSATDTRRGEAIPGVLAMREKDTSRFVPVQSILDLNKLPFPTFVDFDLQRYNPGVAYHPLPILSSRGCINRCSYCIDWHMCAPYRVRDPKRIIEEIQHHIAAYHIRYVEFNDLLCNGSLNYLERLCDLLTESRLGIEWISYAAIRPDMTSELLGKVKQAGCVSLCYGLESASDRVLKRMNKRYTRADAGRVLRLTHQAGVPVRINIIVGFPGETEDDFQETLSFLEENKTYIHEVTNVSAFVLMPSSDLATFPHRFGVRYKVPTDPATWTDENGLTEEERIDRVIRTCERLRELGIGNLIINYNKCDTRRRCDSFAAAVIPAALLDIDPVAPVRCEGRFRRRNGIFKMVMALGLFVFSLAADAFLTFIKRWRGSIIFPGS